MYAKTLGATTMGVDGIIIDVELDVSAGLPSFDIVGMANTMVKESKERVRTAIKNSGIKLNADKVMVNGKAARASYDVKVGDIIVASDTNNHMMEQMRQASGLIVEADSDKIFNINLSIQNEIDLDGDKVCESVTNYQTRENAKSNGY